MSRTLSLTHVGPNTEDALEHGLRLCHGDHSPGLPTDEYRDPDTRIEFFRKALRSACEMTFSHRPAELEHLGQLVGPLARVIENLVRSNRLDEIEAAVRFWVTMFRELTELRRVELEAATACLTAFIQTESARTPTAF